MLWSDASARCLMEATRYKREDSGVVSFWWTIMT